MSDLRLTVLIDNPDQKNLRYIELKYLESISYGEPIWPDLTKILKTDNLLAKSYNQTI